MAVYLVVVTAVNLDETMVKTKADYFVYSMAYT